MAPTSKKRDIKWSEDDLKKALNAVTTNQLSQRAAAAKFNIPRRTLRNHLKTGSSIKKIGRSCVLTRSMEKDLVSRIKKFADIGMPMTPKVIRKQAYVFCQENGIKHTFNDRKGSAGRVWLSKFLKRNPDISKRKAQMMNPARAQKLNHQIVTKHFTSVKELYNELDIPRHPERLYNVDEKGCRLTLHHQQTVLAEKGARRVHLVAQEHAENVTIVACVNAIGTAIPPVVLFKGKRMRPEFNDNLPSGSVVKMAPKGSMTTELFVEFIQHLAKYKAPGKCLLIFDGASSHLDYQIADEAERHDIVLYCLPSNTTHELQPLDKSVNKSFEHHWDQELMLYTYQNPQIKLTKSRFNKILSKVWPKCMTQSNITNGFRATGLYPWDPNVIPEVAFAPSLLTEIPIQIAQGNIAEVTSRCSLIYNAANNSISRPVNRHDSDSDDTFCEEERENSPSLLPKESESFLERSPMKISKKAKSDLQKLVDYSSSSESLQINESHDCENVYLDTLDRHSGYRTPVPSTSGLNADRLRSSSCEYDDETFIYKVLPHSSRRCRIYTSSSSESKEEALSSCNQTQNSFTGAALASEDSDDIPLPKVIKTTTTTKTTFQKLIPTPNFAVVKIKPRRKALNYVGQRITKDLFKDANEIKKVKNKTDMKELQKVTKKGGKENQGASEENSQKGSKKDQKGKQKATNKIIKQKSTTKTKVISKNKNHEDWYCMACKTVRVADMRQCKLCHDWYHEDCVGLTEHDEEDFLCPNCG